MEREEKIQPNCIEFIGDSLSDRGNMNERKLFGIIPMNYLSGLRGVSPNGRFTNAYNWADILTQAIIDSYEIKKHKGKTLHAYNISHESALDVKEWKLTKIKEKVRFYQHSYTDDDLFALKRKHSKFSRLFHEGGNIQRSNAEISDAILTNHKVVRNIYTDELVLDDEDKIEYQGKTFARTYAEGGLTSRRFTKKFSTLWTWNVKHLFSRLILKNLEAMRHIIFSDDKKYHYDREKNSKTLVIEWSGANDMITVSSRPTVSLAKKTVKARIDNVKELIKNGGYKHFVLFSLPDLSLTPRYQTTKKEERNFAYLASKAFNDALRDEVINLREIYPDCQIDIFDVNETFNQLFAYPENFGFDKDKLTQPFLDAIKDPITPDGTSPSDGYAFWDDVHPTADLQARLAEHCLRFIKQIYDIRPRFFNAKANGVSNKVKSSSAAPVKQYDSKLSYQASEHDNLNNPDMASGSVGAISVAEQYKDQFEQAYANQLDEDYNSIGGSWRKSRAPYLKNASLKGIIQYGLLHQNSRTHRIMKEKLHWIDDDNQLNGQMSTLV